MAFTRIQGAQFENTATTANTYSISFGSTIGSGNCVVGFFQYDGSSNTLTSITDDKGNTYTVKDTTIDAGDGAVGSSFILGNITNAPIQINFNFSTSHVSVWGVIDEFSGVKAQADPSEAHSVTAATGVNPTTSGVLTANTITPTTNGDLVWSAITATQVVETWTAGSGWTQGTQSVGSGQSCSEYFTQSTAAGIAPTFQAALGGGGGSNIGIGASLAILAGALVPFSMGDYSLDAGLNALSTATALHVCSAAIAAYADVATYTLGNKAPPSFTGPAAGSPNGRKMTVSAISDGVVTGNGTIVSWAIIDSGNSRLLAYGPLSAGVAVTTGHSFSLGSFALHYPQ